MTKEDELMDFLHVKVFDPILKSSIVPANIKSGTNLTIARMSRVLKKWFSTFGVL